MESQPKETVPATPSPAGTASLSVWQRAVAVFVRPTSAWSGLESRGQWWFPLAVMLLLNVALGVALYDRAILPMIGEQWDRAISEGRMTAEQAEAAQRMMGGPLGMVISVVPQAVGWAVVQIVAALLVWFGVGFVLGQKFRYRLALESVMWASLISVPAQLLGGALAWSRRTMQGLHLGFGILVPESDPPSRLQTALAFFLDAMGPLSLWYLAVLIVGAAALSGAPRKSVGWVLGGLYVVVMIFFSALGAMFNRGG